jgi:hypothetical protein
MSIRNFSEKDPDYEVVKEQLGEWSVGKVYKVKRKSDGKVRPRSVDGLSGNVPLCDETTELAFTLGSLLQCNPNNQHRQS